MAGPGIPTNRTTSSTIAEHVTDHNTLATYVDKFDTTILSAGNGNHLKLDIATGTFKPGHGSIDNKLGAVVGDNSTDNSAVFAAAYSAAAGAAVTVSGFTNQRGRVTIEIPAGHFKIVSPGSLMSDLSISRSSGLTIRGQGREMTTIVFSPTTADQYLMDNNDDWLNVHFEDLTFHSTVSTASFMKSTSSGGAQNYTFSRVNWNGTWKYGIHMIGSNVNSEMTWVHCSVQDDWTAFLYSDAGTGSDQFLNYNFFGCQIEYATGNFIDMAKGGNINVWGGSFIHIGTGAANQTFFKLRGGDHFSGVQRLFVCGIRVEQRHVLSVLIDCEWKRGNVTFLSVDTDSQSAITNANTIVQAKFQGDPDVLPVIVWDGCTLIGKHSYQFNVNSWERARRVIYRACEIVHWSSAHDFLTIVNNGGTGNLGGNPPIEFQNCRGVISDSAQYPFDCTVNWQLARNATPREYRVSIKTPDGSLPNAAGGAHHVWLPLNAVITNVRFYMPAAGSSTSTTWTYVVKTSEGSPTTIATANPGTQWLNGFSVNVDTWFVCNSDVKRHLQLTATVIDQTSSSALCVVTYIA